MAILSIMRDWGTNPTIVRLTVDDDLTDITTPGYLALPDIITSMQVVNNGQFAWTDGQLVAIVYDGGEGFFTYSASDNAFVAETDPGSLSETLPDGDIFVGNSSNIATGVTPSGDIALSNTGVFTINPGAVELAMLASGISPSHVIKFGGQLTTVGGSASEAFTVTGALAASDRAFVQIVNNGTNSVTVLQAVVTNNTLTITFSGDPAADTVFNYQLIRAAA